MSCRPHERHDPVPPFRDDDPLYPATSTSSPPPRWDVVVLVFVAIGVAALVWIAGGVR